MVRKLIKSLLSLSLIAPLSAYALGLGEVRLHSALGERLQADIELLSVSPSEADSITVSLASQSTFNKVGLERPSVLMFLQFEVEELEGGKYQIKVSSRQPINDPFLDFLVEVDWQSGRVLREYTLLLDPPGGFAQMAPAAAAPVTAPEVDEAGDVAEEAVDTAPAAETVEVAEEEGAEEAQLADTTAMDEAATESMEEGAAMTPADESEVVAEETVSEAGVDTVAEAPGEEAGTDEAMDEVVASAPKAEKAAVEGAIVYGPVKANDTLWSIATRLRPSKDVTVQQMMLALLKANPYAFQDNNINRLKRGYVLRIDDPSIINSISKADAAREVVVQTRAWQDYRESVAARAKQRPAKVSAVEAAPGKAVAAKKEPQLKLVAPKGKGKEGVAAGGSAEEMTAGDMSEELMLAMEASAAQRKENEALKKRLSALEGQLEDMEKILTLKDADLKAVQDQLRKQKEATAGITEEKPELVVKAEEKVEPAKPEAAGGETKPAEESAAATEATKAEEATPVTTKPEEAKKPAAKKPAEKKPAKEKKEAKKKKPKATPPPPPKSFIEELLEDTMMLGIAAGAVVFILILLVLLIRRRRKGGFQESILNVGGTSSMMKASDEQGSETSFLSDLAISGMGPGTIQTDEGEADPITEAEVFMAYGRNQQAEEVLRKAREVSPERTDIAAKLLEVYYASKDGEKFEALADETVASLQADDAVWGNVLRMGHELCPQNVLFEAGAGAEAPAAPGTGAAEPAGGDVMDIGLDLDEISSEMESEGAGDMDLDLGLDLGDIDEEAPEEAAGEELDMDLGDFGLGEPEEPAEESSELDMDLGALDMDVGTEEVASEEAGLDFDLDMGATEEAEPEAEGMDFDLDLGAAEEAADEGMDFDMGDLGVAEEEPAADELAFDLDMGELTTEADEGAGDMSLDMDMGDLGGGLEAADESISMDLDAALDDLGGLDDLGDLGDLDGGEDEMTTKLDLAQAYAEMGDAEGARSMLEEVVSGGNDEQKQQAQALIDKL